jgi:hypothetical protein
VTLAAFDFTDRVRPVVHLGIGDSRSPSGQATWDVARWDTAADKWAGVEPTWLDITCDTQSFHCEYGRARTIDRFVPGMARVTVDNATGWADPNVSTTPGVLTVRPGRAIRMGVIHDVYGYRCLFRGFIDAMTPTYDPFNPDDVELICVDALAEVNRAKMVPLPAPVGAGETIPARITRVLDLIGWPVVKRDLAASSDTLIAHDLGGQVADLLGQAADSGGGAVFGDTDGNITFRPRDWQTFMPGAAPDGTIGNVDPDDVCPVNWERPFDRADISTRVIIGRDIETAQIFDDEPAQELYGIEPFERTDLLTESDLILSYLGIRNLKVRGAGSAPRIRTVTLSAATADNAADLMTTVDVFAPSRYRCRLHYPRGTVFDVEHFATAVAHDVTASAWTLDLNLDLAAPYAISGGRWDQAVWDQTTWSAVAELRTEAIALLEEMTA